MSQAKIKYEGRIFMGLDLMLYRKSDYEKEMTEGCADELAYCFR